MIRKNRPSCCGGIVVLIVLIVVVGRSFGLQHPLAHYLALEAVENYLLVPLAAIDVVVRCCLVGILSRERRGWEWDKCHGFLYFRLCFRKMFVAEIT